MLRTIDVLKAVSLAVPLCLLGVPATVSAANLIDTMRADGRFNQLVRAIEAAELADTLRGPESLTVFAPTDEAFAGRPSGELRDLLAGDRERLRTLLRHHVVEGRRPSNDLPPELPSLAGEPLAAEFGDGTLTVADGDQRVTVVAGDIEADNGLIHAIDGVLVPSTLTRPAPEVAAEQPQDEDAGAAAGPDVAIGQPGQEAGVEVAAGRDGPRQVEARATTDEPQEEQPREQPPQAEPTAAPAPAGEDEPAEAAVAVVPSPAAETAEPERVEQPQPEAREQQPQQPQQPQATAPQPEQAEPQQPATAAQPEQVEPQQPRQAQQPVQQQARLTEEAPATGEGQAPPPAAAVTSLETLSDRTVRSSDGEVEGRITDLIFARETGEIELVVVEYGGFLGLGRRSVAVPWQGVRFDDEADQLIIDMSRAELEEAPAFDYDALDTGRYAHYRR